MDRCRLNSLSQWRVEAREDQLIDDNTYTDRKCLKESGGNNQTGDMEGGLCHFGF